MARAFKWILTMEQLLLEKDNRKTIKDTLKLSQKVADWAHGMSEKYSVWIANIILQLGKEEYEKSHHPGTMGATLEGFIEAHEDRLMRQNQNKIRYVLDWLTNPRRDQNQHVDLKKLTLEDAWKMSDDWHRSLGASGKILDESGVVFMTFPDGFYWIDLETNSCSEEGEAMGHCATTDRLNTLWSLRDKSKTPHVTVAWDSEDGCIAQIKGKQNTKPVEKYHPYIVALLLDNEDDEREVTGFRYEYDPAHDFHISDLNEKDFNRVVDERPDLLGEALSFVYAIRRKKMTPEEANEKMPTAWEKHMSFKEDGIHINSDGDDIASLFNNREIKSDYISGMIDGDSYEWFDSHPEHIDIKSYTYDINDENMKIIHNWLAGKEYSDRNGDSVLITDENVEDIDIDDIVDDEENEDFDALRNAITYAAADAERSGQESAAYKDIEDSLKAEGFSFHFNGGAGGHTGVTLVVNYDTALEYLESHPEGKDANPWRLAYDWATILDKKLHLRDRGHYGYEPSEFNERLGETLHDEGIK